jgi:nucleotide-binding universal stress UspA family protein
MPAIRDQLRLSLGRIVLATDLSPSAQIATSYARAAAKRFSSSLILAHVVDPSNTMESDFTLVEPVSSGDQGLTDFEKLQRILDEMSLAGVRATAHTLESHNIGASIVTLSKQLKTDFIVMGTHGGHGIRKAMLGSVAECVIRDACCPVLTIGPNVRSPRGPDLNFSTIVFATDFSKGAAQKAAVALALAQDSTGKIFLCHVLERSGNSPSETLELQLKFEAELEGLIPDGAYQRCSPACIVAEGDSAARILELAKSVGADLIVLGAKHSASWYTPLVSGEVAKVLDKAECPVVTICST